MEKRIVKLPCHQSFFQSYMKVSLPKEPFPVQENVREETAPLGARRLHSRPLSLTDRIYREAMKAGIVPGL